MGLEGRVTYLGIYTPDVVLSLPEATPYDKLDFFAAVLIYSFYIYFSANSRSRDPPWLTTSPHKAEYGHPRHLSTYHDRDVNIKNKTTARATTDQQANIAAPRELNPKREQNSTVGKSSSELSKDRFKKSQREHSLAENKFKSESSDLSPGEESNKNSYQGGDEKSNKDKKLVTSDRKSNKHEKSKENAGENAKLLNKAALNDNDFKPKLQKIITLKEVSNKSGEKKQKSESKSVSVLVRQKSENKHARLTPELTPEISKRILNSQNQDLNDNNLKLSKSKSISLSKPERRDSGGSSAFDFASSVFIDVGPKHKGIATKSDSKGKSSHKKNNMPIDSKANHLKQKVSENETRCKELHNKLVESDRETDEELDRFKNILSKVHDAKWKTKPLILDRRRSSTQSNKSTDSSASISILQPKQEIQHGSKKAFKKYGVKNVELRGRKLFFKGIHIKQPSVNITKQDTQNIIWYRNTLKRKLNKNRNTCSKFKRIRVSKHSSSDSEKCENSAQSLSSSNSSSEEFSSSSFRALSKSKEFQWIVPDSYESDMTDRSNKKQRTLSQRQTSHTKKKEKKKNMSAVDLNDDVKMSSVREKTSINLEEDYFLTNDCSTTASDMITDQVSDCNEKYVKSRLSPKSIGETKEQTEKVLKDKKSVKPSSSKSIEEIKVQTEKMLKDKKSVKSSSTKSIGETKLQTEKMLKDKKSVKSSSTKSLVKTKEQIEMALKGSKSVMSNFSFTFDKNIDTLEIASSRNLKDTDKFLSSGSTETKFKSSKNDIIEEELEKDCTDLDKSDSTYCSDSNIFASLVQPCPVTVGKMECSREAEQFKKQTNANMISPAIRDSDTVTEVPETEVPETEFSQHQISSPENFPVFQTTEHQPIECSPTVNLTKDSEVSHVSERDSTNLAVLKVKKSKSITQSFKKFQSKLKIYQQRKKTDKKLKSKRKKQRLKTQGVWDSDETGGEGDIEDNILNESQTEPKHLDMDSDNENDIKDNVMSEEVQTEPKHLDMDSDNENDIKDNVLSEVQTEPKHLDLDFENEKQIKSVEEVEYSEKEPPSQVIIHQEAETMQIESGSSSDVIIQSLSEEENVLDSLGSRDCHKTVNSAHSLGEIEIEDSEKSSASDEETVISLGNVKEEAIDIKDEPECFLYSDKERVTHANNVKEETTCIEIKDEPEHFLYSDKEKITGAKNLKEEAIEIKEEFENNSDTDKEIGLGLSNWKGEAIETKETEKSSALDKEMAVRHNNVKEGVVAIQETEIPSDSHIELTVGLKNVKAEKIEIKEEPEISSDSDKEMNVTVDLNEVKEEAVEIKEEPETISQKENEMVGRHNVKKEAIDIKEEPAWSKFSYSQEPDTIFLSDNDVVQVDSDSDDELLYSAQRNYSNSLDNDIEDPEYYDFFSSPENCSGSEAEDSDQLTTTFKTTKVEGIKSESADENTNDISLHTLPHETNLKTEADSEFQGLSESESPDDELDYYEIDCHDSDSLLEIETNVTEDRKVSSPAGTHMKKPGILPVTDPYETLTTVDSFDPYGVETQTTLSPNNKRVKSIMSATTKSVNHQKEPSIGNKVLEKSSSVTPTVQKQEIDNDSHEPVSEDEQRGSSIRSPETQEVNSHKPYYEENTQVDMHVNQFNQINKGKKEKAGENIQDQLDDSSSFSDSSLIDAADKQIHLYTQAKGNNKERRMSRFADGLEIKYVEGMFEDEIEGANHTQVNLTNKEFSATSSSDETPIPKAYQTNTQLNKDISTSASDDDISAVRKYDKKVKESHYLKMTQVDVNENFESSLSEPEEEEKAGQDPYMALTQIENIMLSDGEDIFHYLDDQVELTGVDNESSSGKGLGDKNKGQLSEENNGKISDIVSGEPVTNDWYSKNTQIDDLNDSVQTIDDSSITTQVDEMNDSVEIIEENIRGKSNDVYSALTQKIPDTFDDTSEDDIILNDNQPKPALVSDSHSSDKEREKNKTDMYLVATQIDVNQNEKDSDSDWSTADEDLYTNLTQVDSSVTKDKNTDVVQTAQTNNNVPSGRKNARDKNEQEIKLGNIKNKLKQSGSDRKTIEIPMANEKSFFERKFSRQISQSSTVPKSSEVVAEVGRSTDVYKSKKDHIASDSEMLSNKAQPTIQKDTSISTNKSDKWLSKGSGKLMISPSKPPAKRKRRATAGDDSASSFKKKIEDARKQLADRNYQTIFHPESKADHQRKQKSETATG